MRNESFDELVARMPELLNDLKRKQPLERGELVTMPQKGVYVFYENENAIYVGRSNRLKDRIQEHGRLSSRHNSAPFAFNLAKERFEKRYPIPKGMSRNDLASIPAFAKYFNEAKERVAKMEIRVIEINGQAKQSLFEFYAVLELNTKYNDFSTH